MLPDIEIAHQTKLQKIGDIAAKLGVSEDELMPFGHYKAKLSESLFTRVTDRPNGKLVLVTAINPTPAGEGKTTTTVGLGEALGRMSKNAIIALREPSLGPVFGMKGGAAGGGYAQVVPMEDINLHFTGDMHAITSANNLLCALLDNHIQQGNRLQIDPRKVQIRRVMDMNDRALREIVIGLGGKPNGMPREDGFMITVASEVMAILCLARDLQDLKRRFGEMLVAYNFSGKPIFAKDLHAEGAMTALMKDAILPNLVQTLEGTPCIIHGGPFANIAHGCNSVRATTLALKLADYVITEAGFGADLGAEKFFDIKCRAAGLRPDCAVLVATVRALKYNGGVAKNALKDEDIPALKRGIVNLEGHIENLAKFGVPVIVAINRFASDTDAELALIEETCKRLGADYALSEVFAKGGEGGIELAEKVLAAVEKGESKFCPLYDAALPIKNKIEAIAKNIYGAGSVTYSAAAERAMKQIETMGYDKLPVCIAKTQYSFSDDPTLLGRPRGFELFVRGVTLNAGAGFVVALSGDIRTMPGLPKVPAAEKIDISDDGEIHGLF